MRSLDELLEEVNKRGWRASGGHTPHYYQRNELPKNLRKKPYEAYVCNNEKFATWLHVWESADGSTFNEALEKALQLAIEKDNFKRNPANQPVFEAKKRR